MRWTFSGVDSASGIYPKKLLFIGEVDNIVDLILPRVIRDVVVGDGGWISIVTLC